VAGRPGSLLVEEAAADARTQRQRAFAEYVVPEVGVPLRAFGDTLLTAPEDPPGRDASEEA